MPTTPIASSVLEDIKTTLEGITVANGYWYSVRKVELAPSMVEDMPMPFCAVFAQFSSIVQQTIGQQAETLNVRIEGYIKSDDSGGSDALKLRQDIERALMVDTTRGGNAQNTLPRSYDVVYYNEESFSIAGVLMNFDVKMLYTRGSP